MASCLLSVALLFTTPVAPSPAALGSGATSPTAVTSPRPIFFEEFLSWPTSNPTVVIAGSGPAPSSTASTTTYDPLSDPVSFAPTENSAPTESQSPPAEPEPTVREMTLRERALNRLAELGAQPWQLGIFDCIGWHESNWANLRNRQSGDDGVFQINDIHDPQLRAQGLDPYVPEDAATFAWQLSREGRTFKPWVVAPKCGV